MVDSQYLTPPQIARRFGVKAAKIIGWIRAGELDAVDVSNHPGIGRPRFRVSIESLERFEARRQARPQTVKMVRLAGRTERRWF